MRYPATALVMLLIAGCAGTKEAAASANPVVGVWSYAVDTPQGVYRGDLVFEEAEGALGGTIRLADQTGEAPLRDVAFDGETLTFAFTNPNVGGLLAELAVADDAFEGPLDAPGYGLQMPFTGTRAATE